MLKKLLKYDFKPVFKYWWILAITSLGLSVVGGVCISILANAILVPEAITALATILLFLVIMGLGAFSAASVILAFARFYKNFFTDEGYLTFTLPVKRSQLLNSKLIMSITVTFLTVLVVVLDVLIMLCVAFSKEVFSAEFWQEVSSFFNTVFGELGVYSIVYVLEVLLLFVLYIAFSSLFLFCCITVASIITKRAKLITAIGIYYVANGIVSTAVQIFYIFGYPSIISWIEALTSVAVKPVVALILLAIILFIAVFCGLFYVLQYWILDRKLNLN